MLTSKSNLKDGKLPEVVNAMYLPMMDDSMSDFLDKGDLVIFAKNDYDFTTNKVIAVALPAGETANSIDNYYITISTKLNGDVITTSLPDGSNSKDFVTDAILGKASFAIPKLGYAVSYALTMNGLIYLFAVPLAMIIIGLILNHLLKVNDKYDEYELEEVDDDNDSNNDKNSNTIRITEEIEPLIEITPPSQKHGREVLVTKRSYNTANPVTSPDLDFAKDLFQTGEITKQPSSRTSTTIPFQITNDMLISKEKFDKNHEINKAKQILDNAHPLFANLENDKLDQKSVTIELPEIDPEVIKATKESEKKHANFTVDFASKQKGSTPFAKAVQSSKQHSITKPDPVTIDNSDEMDDSIKLLSLDDSAIDDLFNEIFSNVDDEFTNMKNNIDNIVNEDNSSKKPDITSDSDIDDLLK